MPDDPNAPSMWVIMFWGFIFMGGFILLLWLNHKWQTRGRPKSETPEGEEHPRGQIPHPSPTLTSQIAGQIMSRLLGSAGPIEEAGERLHATSPGGVQGFANGRNPVNDDLRPQPFAQGVIPEEARDIIKFWTRVEAVEHLTASGKMGMVEAIELIFECKRNGRADSVYGKARAAIQARSESTYRQRQDRLVELQLAAAHED
jgi:hypothetical protein